MLAGRLDASCSVAAFEYSIPVHSLDFVCVIDESIGCGGRGQRFQGERCCVDSRLRADPACARVAGYGQEPKTGANVACLFLLPALLFGACIVSLALLIARTYKSPHITLALLGALAAGLLRLFHSLTLISSCLSSCCLSPSPGIATVGIDVSQVFFMHAPFPTSEVFRSLSIRDELITSILANNIVGFHTFAHARHFMQSCKRISGLNFQSRVGGRLGVEYHGRCASSPCMTACV